MPYADPDAAARWSAFQALRRLQRTHGSVLEWGLLDQGFVHAGQRLRFANRARGIFRPKEMRGGALSIKTTVPRRGRTARYDDVASDAGHFVYRFQGEDPGSRDNRLLAHCYAHQLPLIYLYGLAPGRYLPVWPVYVIDLDVGGLSALVTSDDPLTIGATSTAGVSESVYAGGERLRREYQTVQAKRRLHQQAFRLRVLEAYGERCAVCGLPCPELLEAAHIIPDRDVRGVPEVPNGMSLCRLHHGAFDRDLLGVRPDHRLELSDRIDGLRDGPTWEHAIRSLDGARLRVLPRAPALRPRREYLEERYEQFRASRAR